MTATLTMSEQLVSQPMVPQTDAKLWENPPTDDWSVIDSQLHGWLSNPDALVDCDAIPPSRPIIRAARELIPRLRQNWPAPAMVVPDGTGGISFEFHSSNVYRNLEVLADGRARLTVFRNGQVHARRFLEV